MSHKNIKLPLVEKYRPKNFNDLLFDELDAAVSVPLKKSVAPLDKSINEDNEFIIPIVFKATS